LTITTAGLTVGGGVIREMFVVVGLGAVGLPLAFFAVELDACTTCTAGEVPCDVEVA
jgi:hypothetical protein